MNGVFWPTHISKIIFPNKNQLLPPLKDYPFSFSRRWVEAEEEVLAELYLYRQACRPLHFPKGVGGEVLWYQAIIGDKRVCASEGEKEFQSLDIIFL